MIKHKKKNQENACSVSFELLYHLMQRSEFKIKFLLRELLLILVFRAYFVIFKVAVAIKYSLLNILIEEGSSYNHRVIRNIQWM